MIRKYLDDFLGYSNLDKGMRTGINKLNNFKCSNINLFPLCQKKVLVYVLCFMKDNIANTGFSGPQGYFPH